MADARYLGSMNPDELRKLGKQRAIEELAKRSTNRSEKPSGEDPSKGQYLGSMPPDELILRMELMRDKAKKDYLRENYESRNVLEDTAAALTAGTLQLAEMSARAARLGREPEDTPNLTKFIEGIDKFREDKQFLKPSREALTREGRRWLYEGVSSAIPSVGLGLPGAAVGSFGGPIGTVGGFAGSAGTVFGMAEFDEFWENARKGAKEGKIDPAMMSEINKKALMSAFAEGGMEAVSNAIDMLAFKVGKVVTAPLKESVRGMLTKGVKGVAKDMAKGYAVALPNEVATEMMQNYLTTKMRKDLGINEVEPIEAAKQSAGPAAVMTLLFGVGAAKINYEQRLSALKALQDPDTKTKARMAAARAIADELKVYDDKHGTTYAKQWVGDSFSSIMRKKPVDIDSKIIKKYSQEPRKGEEPPEAEPPVQEAPPETPPPPPGSGEITGGPGTTPPPMGEDEPILPEDELDAEDAAKEHDEDDLDKIIETDDAADETDTEPTDAEIEAGNYKKGHVKLHGMDISIENPRGSTRKGADEDGKEWETTFTHHYGYIKGTVGRDKDHIDTFIGPNPASDRAFVVNQVNPKTGKFDEHKIMLGFDSIEEAQQGYLSNYEAGWTGLGSIHELDVEDLRTWTKDGDTKIEYDPQDYPEFHEETIDDEETVTGGAPGTPAPGGEIGITGGPRPQGETGGIGLPEDILKGLEEIFGEKPPAGEVQGGERVPEGEKPGEPAKDQNIAIKDLLVRNGWNTNEEYGYIKDGGEDRVWILSKVPEAWSEETVPPKSMDDPVIVQLEEYSGKVLETKRYDTFREFIDAELVKYGDMFEDQGEIEAKGQKEKPGEITGGERAPKGEKPEGETKPAEGETTAPSGETKPEKPKKEESKQDKAVKAFDELADESVNKTEKDAFVIIDQEDSGQYGRLVESVMHILRDMAKSVKSMKGHPDQVKKNVENALELLSESDSWIGSISESSRSLGANMATQFNSLTVYNKAQWLAREIGDAVGEGRFQDALKYLNEIKTKLGKGNADYSKWVMSFKMNDDGTLKPYTSLQEKGKLKWGKKIGGSRADIAGMSGTQKKAEVNKEFVWPSPDYVSMVKQGTEPHVAYLIKRIRDSIPASPKGDLSDSDFDIYVESLEQIRDSFDNVRTEDEMKDACSGLLALAKVARRAEGNQASVFRNRKWMNTSELLYRGSIKKFEKEIKYVDENGWPGGGAWRRGIRIVETTARNENDDIVEVWAIERRLGQGRFEYWGQVATGFETREAAEKYLEETLRPQIEQELKNRKLTRPRLKKVIRKGPDYRGGKDIEPEKFLKTFGFRKGWGEEGAGMETGKWNKSTLQMYINCAYDSFMDLARALNVDPKVMSLNGRISIAFGARGHGGLAMAHYESTRMVINLTKMNGAGSLAHEWGHALDHYMRSLFSETPGMAGHYLSDFTFKTSFYDAGHLNGNDELREAMYLLWNDRMHSRYSTPSEILALAENVISKNKSTLSVLIENLSKKVKDEGKIERFTKMTEEIIDADPADAAKKIDALGTLYQELSGSTLETKYIVGLKDNYKYIAVKLREAEDAKNGASVGSKRLTDWVRGFDRIPSKARREYYSSPIEMWARAFESFIEDTIAGYGLSSNYLVHGTFNDKYSYPIYPSDEERDSINTGISDVIKLLGFPEFKEESKPIITTEWDNPQFEEDEEETEGPEETETETPTAEITIEDYTEKSIVVRDHTPDGKHKKRIAELGGEYNPNLKRGAPGFIFPKWKRERVEEAFADILYGGEHGKPIYPYQDLQLEDLKSNEKVGILAKNMLALLKSGWHVGKNATAIRAEVARMLNTKPDKITDWGQGYTKDIDELIEYALVMRSREIIDSAEVAGENIKETYDRLKDLYENQPRLGSRTSDSAENQAYSTPLHIAWIMQKASEIGEKTSVYEPTAGTGMLLAMASPENVTANEIDKRRRAILKDQGMAEVTDIDGRKAVSLSGTLKAFDVVLANPPFGKTDSKSIDGFLMSKLEHQIAVDALKAMKDRGRAAIIIGGHNFKDGKMSVTDKIFFNWLYSKYNVTANIEMPGSVYAKQGTTFPFRILFINGVNKTGKGIAPEKDDIISLGSTDDLFDLLQKGELYGARRISPEGTEDVEEGMGPVGGSGGARGGGKGFGSSDVLPGPGGETGDDGGKKPKPGGRASGSTGGPSGGIMAPGTEGSGGGTGTDDGRTGGTGDGSADVPAGAGGPGSPGVGEGQGGSQRGRTGRPGEESGLEDIPGISPVEKQIASMSDEDIDSLVDGLVEKNTEKSAGDLAKEAGKELAAGLHDAVKGLTTLFTPKDTLSMGLVFDEETYRKALPLFQSSLEHIKASGIIGKEAVEKLASDLLNKFGNSIAPFVKRFMKEVRTETKNLHQVPYEALSKRPPVEDTFIPKNMARPLRQALERIQNQVGDIDAYITSKLEYPDVKTMWEHFSPDQIDAIAIGIYNMSRGQTLIVGDQTGVGKGRVGAAMIRYAHLQGKRAVFFTEKPNLFTDNYRDIVDIGWGDKFKPFIVASNEELADIRDQEGTKVFELLPSDKRRAAMAKFAGTDDPKEIKKYGLSGTPADEDGLTRDENVLADYNTILVTYSQVNVENLQRRFLSRVARGSMLILDESHNAAGSGSNTGEYMQGLIQGLGPNGDLMFLSATFAKRPDTMGLYIQRTAQEAANMKPKEIVDAIIAGKTPMQEWVCASLTKTGQHVRREKSFRGIEMRTYFDSKNRELHEGIADGVMENAREIMDVDRKITKAFNAAVARAIKAGSKDPDAVIDIFGVPWKPGWVKGDDGKARMSNTVSKSNFAATVHNLVRQTLFSLKCDLAVEQAIKELEGKDNPLHDKDGYLIRGPRRQKPVIAVSGTLESFLMEASKSGELVSGNSYEMKLKDVIRIYHRRNLRVLIKDRKGNEQRYTMNPDLFPEDLKEEFYRVERDILEKTPDLPGSPIDYMIYKLRKAGVRVGEITGRKFMLEHDLDTGRPVFKPRKDKRAEAIIGFNNGPSRNEDIPELDCLIVNSAGSAGLSIHAGPKTDKVPRIYLGVQAELDIDKEVQKMGRINRKGQVVLPEFRHLALDIPAEVRPATVLSRKMRSMSANTSANADSPLANKDFPDMINHHGDEITDEWMTDHTEVMVSMGTDDLTYLNVSGKIAIQPVAVQREFFDEVEETYNLRMENLKKRGEWDLDVETYDYRADTVSKDITVEGSNEDNPFGGSTYMEEVTTENRSKPMWWDEITKEIEKELGGKTPEEYNEAFLEKMRERMEEYRKKVLARWEEAKEKRRQAAEKKKAEAPKEGEDYITDDIDTGKTDKGQDDKEEKEPAILAKMKKQYDDLEHLLTGGSRFSPNFEVGTTLRITRGFSVGATVLKIRARGKEGNPVEPGKIEVTLAFTGMEREIEIPLSKLRRMHDEGKEDDYIMAHEDIGGERWDSMRSALVRETRHIVTGNLLQGFIGFQGSRRAQLIRYTTIDGNVKDGIIMPRGFESPTDSSTSLVRISQNKAYAFMQASGLNRSDQYLDDEAVRVTPSEIRVAGSRQLGGKYFLDPELKSLVKQNNFEKSGKYYIAQYNQANQKEIIDVLTKLGCRFSVLRGAYNIAFGGLEEQDDLAEFALGGKKVAQNQLLVSAINNAIAPITEKWGGGPRIYVLENIGKLPDGLREQAYRANSSSPGSVRGIYHRGSVYLIAENLSGAAEAQEVLLHEIIGHHGLRRAFGRRLDSLLDEVFSLMSKKDKDLVNKYYGFNLSRKSGQRRLAEEYIAKQAEKGALTPTIWQKIIAAIRKWLAEMGFSIKASDEKLQEIVTHALSMSRMYMNSEEATEGPDAYSIAEDKPEIDTKSLFPEEIIAALAPILKRWKNHPDITVADSISELPAGLRRQAIMAGAITGAFYNDTVYLVADGIGSIDEAYKTILHETVGHWGLRKTLGPGFDSFLSRLYADIDKARLQPIAEQYGLDLSRRSDQLVCMEEYLALLAEKGEKPSVWKRFIAWVRVWLIDKGFKLKVTQNDVDVLIASALGKARKYVQGGTAYAVEGFEGGQPVLRVAAFHGSPHTFDKFSTEKIGTGEGAQAYGYGLYFAGKKEVAEFYKKELAQGSITFDSGETITPDWDDPGYNAIRLLRDAGNDYDKAISSARELTPSDWGLSVAGKLREYRKKGGKVVGAGHLYEVELAPEEDEYLLWDKPLSEQGEKVKKAISDDKKLDEWFNSQKRRDAGVKLSQRAPWEDTDRLTGRDFYRTLSDMIGRDNHERSNGAIRNESDDKAASEYLRSLGIRGIKYLDGTSRGKGEGAYNYVIFSDQDVEIKARFRKGPSQRIRKLGIPAPIGEIITSHYNNIQVKKHPDYAAAKKGDNEAAVRLVRDMVKPDTAQAVKDRVGGGAIFVYPHAIEEGGVNAIPAMLAGYYAEQAGGTLDDSIVQNVRAFHTGAKAMERLIARATFTGDVVEGGRYVLVDDVTTMGGTLAELANHIQDNGGVVVGVATLTNASRSRNMTPSKQVLSEIERRYGSEIREQFNIEPSALTAAEAGYLLGFRDADSLRNRATAARQERAERLRAKGVRPEEVTRFRVAPSPTETPLDTKSLFPEVQKRLDEAKGIGNLVRTKEKAKHHVSAMWHSFRRHFPHLDPDETGDLINILRIYEAVPEYSKYKAKGMIEDILGGLTDDEYTVFSYNIILADLMKDLDDPILGATMIEKDELPFGYTNKDQVEKDLNHFRDQAIKSPAIMEALRKREKSITDLRHNLVRYGLLDKKVLEDTNYYHHQVMEYWGLKRMTKGAGVSSKDVRPHKKGWMIAREGSIKDYNTEYIESEFEVFAQGIAQVETKKTMDRLDRSANIIKSLRAQAKLKNYGACLAIFEEMGLIERVENEKTGEMREITPFTPIEQQIAIGFSMLEKLAFDDKLEAPQEYQGVLDWLAQEYLNRKEDREYGFFDGIDDSPTHPKLWAYLSYIVQRKDPGSGAAARIFKGIKEKERLMKDTLGAKFRTFENEIPEGYTIWRPEPNTAWYMTNSITDQVLEQVLKGEKSLKDEDVRKVLARGVDAMWVIPEGLAATLSNFREYKDEGPVGKAAEFTVTSWKQWILINPFRVIKYNLNNMSGDFDICWAYDPDIIRKYAWGAAKDLWMEARHKEISPVLKAELEEAHRVGVLGTGMTVQDIPDITNQMTLDGYLEVLSGRNVSYISKTWNVLKKYTTYRENILRLASYRYFRDRIISGEKNIYGASNADMIDKIKNDTDRAAHLARELVGDYGNLTVAGQWMRRKLIPFYSWCVPEYTEILTREGWKTYDQLRVGEEALTYNIQKRTTEWQEVQDKAAYPFDGDLVTIQNSYGFKYQFTEDHRVVVIEKYKDQRKVVLAKDLKTHQHIPLVAPHEFTGVSVLSETDAALLGWLVTDGYFRVRAKSPNSFEAMLYQKKAECVELIRDKFAEYISSESVHPETGVICFRLKAAKLGEIRKVFGSKDDLPGIVTQLGEKECQAMYDAMLAAEGTAVNGFVAFPQNNGPVLGAFQILCYMLGKAGHIRPKTCRGKEQHSLYVKKGDKIQLSKWKNTREHYNGMVWCPKTENGTWIMRQNGKVMITGNCEINAPRYVRLFHNLPMEGEGRGRLATALSAKLAGKAFKLSAKMMTLYGLVVLWNMIFFPDEEDELGDMQRRQLHLILGRRGDGSIITVRFQGALSDALSWFGLENPAKELSDLAEGRKTWGEQGWELIKSAPNRFINSTQPFVKLAAETLMGKSLFPDAFNPRPIRDRVEHASRMFSLENIYKHAAGKPTRNQWRELDFWQDFLYLWGYEQLPGEAAYFDTRERVRRFLDRKGLNPGYFQADSSSKSAALYNYRRAMQLGDVEVAKKNYDRYMELGGTKQSMKTSMRLSHPAAGIPKKHREEFYRSLTERDRERMQAAVEWYNTIYGGM